MILTHSPICEHISVLHERFNMTITWPFSANSIKFCMDRRETIIHRLSIRNPGYDAYYSILIYGRGLTLRMRPRVWGPWYPTEKLVHTPPGGKFFGNLLSYYCVWKIFRPWIPIGYIILALVIPSHSFLVPKSSFLRLNLIYVPATWVTDCFPFIQDSKKKNKKGPSNVSLTAETVGPGLHRRITEDLQYERILPKLDPTVRKRAINGIKPQSS